MNVFLVILITMHGQNFERREPMLDLKACWERLRNAWLNSLQSNMISRY